MSQQDLDPTLDGQLELKKRARRRLVGAAALAILAAVVLPMVMDHEPRQPVQDVQVRIPSQDAGGFTSRILPAKSAPTPLPPATEAESKPAKASEAAPAVEPKPAEVKPAESKPAETKPLEPARSTEKAAEKPAAKADEARAAAVLAGGGGEQWVVQLGAYKEAGNVKILLAKIKQMNISAYTEEFDSPQGPRTRVRAGPFATREAAEKAQTRIRTIGVNGPVAPK